LKPENLLITENNRIKVCDFGFSRSIARTEIEKKKLSFCGTEGYMAPELILCMENYTISVDVFSFGIILISLLILEIPTGDGPNDIPPFARAIPGFGLDSEQVEKSLNILVPHKGKT
jgi:serine/threonine protein kinase